MHVSRFRDIRTEQWAQAILLVGSVITMGFLLGGITNRLTANTAEDVRQQLRRHAVAVNQAMQGDAARISAVIGQVRRDDGAIAWIRVRDQEGAVIAHTGLAVGSTFTKASTATQLRQGKPVYTTRSTALGTVVVEAFSLRLPAAERAAVLLTAAYGGRAGVANLLDIQPGHRLEFGIVEIAAFLNYSNRK
jgi:hypothetical protein